MRRFERVIQILDQAVGGPTAFVGGPHRDFWRGKTLDQFIEASPIGEQLLVVGDSASSNLVLAIRGETPFGADTGTPGGIFSRMPAGLSPVAPDDIAFIAQWIDDGCPDDEIPASGVGDLELLLNGAPSASAFVVVGSADTALTSVLTIRTLDNSAGDVAVRAAADNAVALTITPEAIKVSDRPVQVSIQADQGSGAPNDTTIEIVQGATVVDRLTLTTIEAPRLIFSGRFQCRLATDPDPWDHSWGINASFGSFAVEGPDPLDTDEPPMDRVIRFHDPVGLRPFCPPIGVVVTAVEAEVGGSPTRFEIGDSLIGEPVRLGPNSFFDSRNGDFAPAGFEPISDFRLEIGSAFSGESAASVPRSNPMDPPGSTAPYADGVFLLDDADNLPTDFTPWKPSDLGYPEETWRLHADAVIDVRVAELSAQATTPGSPGERIREARIQKHQTHDRGMKVPLQFVQRYLGLIDRNMSFEPDPTGMLAYLASLPAVEFKADFLDYDIDCHSGAVIGSLGAPSPITPQPADFDGSAEQPKRVPRSPEAISSGS